MVWRCATKACWKMHKQSHMRGAMRCRHSNDTQIVREEISYILARAKSDRNFFLCFSFVLFIRTRTIFACREESAAEARVPFYCFFVLVKDRTMIGIEAFRGFFCCVTNIFFRWITNSRWVFVFNLQISRATLERIYGFSIRLHKIEQ